VSEPVTSSETGTPPSPGTVRVPRYRWLRAVLPHVLTALVAVVVTLGVQRLWQPPAPAAGTLLPQPATPPGTTTPATPISTPNPSPAGAATPFPAPTEPPLAAALSRQELIDLRAQDDRLWAAIYLIRALSQAADAETSLRANDLAGVEQTLTALDESLAQAYARAADPDRNPIDQIRRDASAMREDLYLRPEGMDARLARLQQAIVTLIEARR